MRGTGTEIIRFNQVDIGIYKSLFLSIHRLCKEINLKAKKLVPDTEQAFQNDICYYTATLCSLKASFNDVLRSVLSLRFPIIRAQGTW